MDELNGEWFHDPALAAAFLEKGRTSSSNVATAAAAASSSASSSSTLLPTGQPKKSAQKSDKNQNAHMPSSTAMSENIFNYANDGNVPDNYEEGWYQDEYGNWLNQFDWKQVRINSVAPQLPPNVMSLHVCAAPEYKVIV